MKAKLVFLGSGGGTFFMTTQLRATGGIILELNGTVFHIDPGPGATARARQFGIDLRRVKVVMVSHAHIDHINDLNVVVGAMTAGYSVHRGILVTNESIARNFKDSLIFGLSLKSLEKVVPLKPGEKTNVDHIEILATETRHDEDDIGFVIKGSKQISYVSDTEYFPGLSEWHKNSDVLILNVLRPNGKKALYQLNCYDAIKLISEIKPKLTIFTHFGRKMENPEMEAKIAADKTGEKVIASMDGLVINLEDL